MSQLDSVVGMPISDPVYHFPWPVLESIVAGRSAIDLPGLRFSTVAEAGDFLTAYGFDAHDPEDADEMREVARQTRHFLDTALLPYGGLPCVPAELPDDFRELLLLASTPDHALRDWACTFLRVGHAVVHARYSQDRMLLTAARQQIFDRFSAHLKVGPDSMLVSDGEMHIPLIRCDFKAEKPWESLVLKLLHKVDSVAQEVYDHLGVRFVVPDKAYALLLLKYFRAHNVFAYPNIKPSRSVNTLVDLDRFRAGFEDLEASYHAGELSFKEFTAAVHRLGDPAEGEHERNPHSAGAYRAMQFTARALVKWHGGRSFVPFEVQITDALGDDEAQAGVAGHAAYRERQRAAVCRRVFPWAPPGAGGDALAARAGSIVRP